MVKFFEIVKMELLPALNVKPYWWVLKNISKKPDNSRIHPTLIFQVSIAVLLVSLSFVARIKHAFESQ